MILYLLTVLLCSDIGFEFKHKYVLLELKYKNCVRWVIYYSLNFEHSSSFYPHERIHTVFFIISILKTMINHCY